MAVKVVFSLLVLMVLRAAAQQVVKYFEVGGKLELDPKFSQPINSITWKHKGNLVAEYIKDAVPLEYLGDLRGRAEVDLATGTLTVSRLNKADDGEFTVEINNFVQPTTFKAVGFRNLGEFPVEVIQKPKSCDKHVSSCTLTCGGEFREAEPVQYFWRRGEPGEWKEETKTISVTNDFETRALKSFTCRVSNAVSQKDSDPEENPFHTEKDSGGGRVVGIVFGILGVGALIGGVGTFCYRKYKSEAS